MSNFITSQADHFVGPDLARWQRRLAALHPGRRFAETRLRWLRWSPIIWASLRFYVRKKIWKHTMNQPSMVKARLDNDYNILIYIIMILPRSSRETCRTDDMNWHHRTVSICLDHCALLCVLWAWPRFRLTRHALLGCWATPAGHQLTNKERGSQALAARCCKVSTISIYFVHFCSTDFYPFTIFHHLSPSWYPAPLIWAKRKQAALRRFSWQALAIRTKWNKAETRQGKKRIEKQCLFCRP
jgi:hypothetical protein